MATSRNRSRRATTKPDEPLPAAGEEPPSDCRLCPRLVSLRHENRATRPGWHNAPVPPFGPKDTRLLIVGLAPGLGGANRTGRPFTGDFAGDLLYATLAELGLSQGQYGGEADDGLVLNGCRITNAVRCLPPQNKPVGAEITTCNRYLVAEISALENLAGIVALGRIAHDATLAALGLRRAAFPFSHGARHDIGKGRFLADSYHCSRYNTNTGRLTVAMFRAVMAAAATDAHAD